MAVVFIDLDGTLTHTSDIRYKEYKDGIMLIDDSYNASLDSIKSAS